MKKIITYITLLSAAFILVACGESSEAESSKSEEKHLHLATSPGPYSDLFLEEVAPILEEQGYTIESSYFSDIRSANMALEEESANLNVEQNTSYINNFNKEAGTDFVPMAALPTIASALYPANKTSLGEVEAGDVVGIPVDPANLSRALLILEKTGWIELDSEVDTLNATLEDITKNHEGIEIVPMDSPSLPPSLPDLDYASIPGAIVYDAGIDPESALVQEDILPELFLQLTVKSGNADKEWVKDVIAVYQSDEFRERIETLNEDPNEPNWALPE